MINVSDRVELDDRLPEKSIFIVLRTILHGIPDIVAPTKGH